MLCIFFWGSGASVAGLCVVFSFFCRPPFSSSFPLPSVEVQRPAPRGHRPLYLNTRQGKGRGEDCWGPQNAAGRHPCVFHLSGLHCFSAFSQYPICDMCVFLFCQISCGFPVSCSSFRSRIAPAVSFAHSQGLLLVVSGFTLLPKRRRTQKCIGAPKKRLLQ